MNTKTKALLASYGRSVLSAGIALYLAGVTDPVVLLNALAAGIAPVALRYLNPKDASFGRELPPAEEIDQALRAVQKSSDEYVAQVKAQEGSCGC
jgi:c-di-GMP-related signal transduction protein